MSLLTVRSFYRTPRTRSEGLGIGATAGFGGCDLEFSAKARSPRFAPATQIAARPRSFMPLEFRRDARAVRLVSRRRHSLASGCPIAIDARLRTARVLALALAALCTGCAIRYDATGVTRVGVGLWGFGDPPGVHWNLDAPRRELPELPAGPRPELPPRRTPPDLLSRLEDVLPAGAEVDEWTTGPIEDNPIRASRRLPDFDRSLAARARVWPRLPACG